MSECSLGMVEEGCMGLSDRDEKGHGTLDISRERVVDLDWLMISVLLVVEKEKIDVAVQRRILWVC